MSEYKSIPYMPGFEISRTGEVRNCKTGNITKHRHYSSRSSGLAWVQCLCLDGARRASQVNVLLEEAWGVGAAQAAGLPAPNLKKVRISRDIAENRRGSKYDNRSNPKAPTIAPGRKCTTCGRPTADYRCAKCWRKLRGYDADGADERAGLDSYHAHTSLPYI